VARARARPADIALALCRLVSYNIAHLAFLNAKLHGVSRVFFGGFFIRGHAYTMDVISYAINFWSRGEMEAAFLRHEGFLGAMGAFLKGHPLQLPTTAGRRDATGGGYEAAVRARFSERFSAAASLTECTAAATPAFVSLSDKVDWVEKYMAVRVAPRWVLASESLQWV
jgi:bifunctional damage-control phosphatase, subfamily II, fusion protein